MYMILMMVIENDYLEDVVVMVRPLESTRKCIGVWVLLYFHLYKLIPNHVSHALFLIILTH